MKRNRKQYKTWNLFELLDFESVWNTQSSKIIAVAMPTLTAYFYCEKRAILNVSNLLSQCFHIASSLGPDLRPLKTILTSLAERQEEPISVRNPWSRDHRPLTCDPFPIPRKAQHHTWVPVLGLPLVPDCAAAKLDNRAPCTHQALHYPHSSNSGSQRSLSVPVTLTEPKFHASLDSFLSLPPHISGVSVNWGAIRGLWVWVFVPALVNTIEWLQRIVNQLSICWGTEVLPFGIPCSVIQVSRSSTQWQTALWINRIPRAPDICEGFQEMIRHY